MRKQFLLLAAVATTVTMLNLKQAAAQNTDPFWSLAGNSNASGASILGTTNATPLRLFTNNAERIRIDPGNGNIGINNTAPIGRLTVQNNGSVPSSDWITAGQPLFAGFGEGGAGSADYILSMASNSHVRSVLIGRRSRGTLASPTIVQNNDFLFSFLASGYDGSDFQNPATIDIFVDGTPSAGNVPARISLVTGTNIDNRQERLKVGSTGNFTFNTNQMFLNASNGNLGIGTTSPNRKLHVVGKGLFTAGLSVPGGGITATHTAGDGLYAKGSNIGVLGEGTGTTSTGVSGKSAYVGVYGTATGSAGSSYGVYGLATGSGGYGIYGYSSNSHGIVGATGNGGAYAGYFAGNVYSSGNFISSDRSLKQGIADVASAMDVINKLHPKLYSYRQDGAYKLMNLPQGTHYGLIAQDVEQVLPGLVKATIFETGMVAKGKSGTTTVATQHSEKIDFKAVNYTELIPIMVKGMQEQSALIEKLQSKIETLEKQIVRLSGDRNSITFAGSGALQQNVPNPAQNTTRIGYTLPANSRGQLLLTDNTGRTLRTLSLNASGVADINTASLSSGIYNYTLVVDGKAVETKKLTVMR